MKIDWVVFAKAKTQILYLQVFLIFTPYQHHKVNIVGIAYYSRSMLYLTVTCVTVQLYGEYIKRNNIQVFKVNNAIEIGCTMFVQRELFNQRDAC